MNYPQYISAWVLDTIFPVKCMECGLFPSHLKKEYLCRNCIKKLPIKKSLECIGCKTRNSSGKTCILCKDINSIDQLLIVSDYNDPLIVKLIQAFKYKFIKETLEPISVILKKYLYLLSKNREINLINDETIITFVPMRPRRLNWRGFNQAELIACSLGDAVQQNVIATIIQTQNSKPQALVKERAERLNKPYGIFKVTDSSLVRDKTIVVVDDVCTTGATLNECARVLKEAGARKVIGFVVARG